MKEGALTQAILSHNRFKMGMYLDELQLPMDQALATAREIGAEYLWFTQLNDMPPIADLSDAQVDRLGDGLARHGLKLLFVCADSPFKLIHLTDLEPESLAEHPQFRSDFDRFVRSMEIAKRLGVGEVSAFTFAWPGEYSSGKPTWPMRWLTRGGMIADVDMDKLVEAFSLMIDRAEEHGVDIVLAMMPWNYTNTTTNFRRLAERLGSRRIKVMWGPADNYNSGELDVAITGLNNVRPYLHCLHIKDLRVNDGLRLDFEYTPLGEGDVDYATVLRTLRDQRVQTILSVATHFLPASGSAIEAMRANFASLMSLIERVESESPV